MRKLSSRRADEEVGRDLDRAVLEEHLEPALFAPAHAVEDRDQRPDDAGLVLDGAHGGVLDVVAEHVARARVHASRRAEQPGQDVGAVDRVLEERAAARTCAIGTPRAVAGHDVARRPVLVVAQDVAHRASELAAAHDGSQLVDHRMKSRVEPDLRGGPGTGDERAHLAHGREVGRERLLAQQGLSCGERGAHEIAMRRRRRDDDDRVDVGIVDDRVRVRPIDSNGQMRCAARTASSEKSVTATGRTSPSSASSRSA